MSMKQATLFGLLLLVAATGWCAASCVHNKETSTYQTASGTAPAQRDCLLPDMLKSQAELNGIAGRTSDAELRTVTRSDSEPQWELRIEDGSIYAALKRWSAKVGWQISWEIPVDFPVEIVDVSAGQFEESVRRVLTAFRVSDYPPYPCFHENKVIRVVRRIQGNDDECR